MDSVKKQNFTTPKLSHLKRSDYKFVYEPAEDTFLFLDALEAEYEDLKKREPLICLEIGSGSGCVITFLASILGNNSLYLSTDINNKAAIATLQTSFANKVSVDPILTDLITSLTPRLSQKIDVVLFNPPYVVTESSEIGSKSIEAAWAGGIDGREVLDRALPMINDLLSDSGVFYLVAIRENKPDEIIRNCRDWFDWESSIIATRKAGHEGLMIIKFWRRNKC